MPNWCWTAPTGEKFYIEAKMMRLEEQKRFLRNFCDQHPLKNFLEAVFALWASFPADALPVDDAPH